jgi:transcription elongation GreA/GreB family factor
MNYHSLASKFKEIEKIKTHNMNDLYRARVGSQVKLLDKESLTSTWLTLAEPNNSRPEFGKISCLSLLGSELLGVVTGQEVSVSVMGRVSKFQVMSIRNTQKSQRR